MVALMFGKQQAYKLNRTYQTKTGEDMVVIPMLILETGGLLEQHFSAIDWAELNVKDDLYFSPENPVVVELKTLDRGMSKKIVAISRKGLLKYSVG